MSRELDAKVAEKIFGHEVRMLGAGRDPECGSWTICIGCDPMMDLPQEERVMFHLDCDQPGHKVHPCIRIPATAEASEWWEVCPDYSSDMNDAWQVVEKLRPTHKFQLANGTFVGLVDGEVDGPWLAAFYQGSHSTFIKGSTAPEAVCLAALKAVEVKE